jgi:hypothetical protein
LLATGAYAASADAGSKGPVTLMTAGNFAALSYDADTLGNPFGRPMCTIRNMIAPSKTFFLVYYYDGSRFDFFKGGWKFAGDTPVQVSVQIDNNPPITGKAIGRANTQKGGANVILQLGDATELKPKLEMFASGNQLTVTFPEGNERPWTINLTGSREVSDAFAKCMANIPAETQPVGGKPTQPTQSLN